MLVLGSTRSSWLACLQNAPFIHTWCLELRQRTLSPDDAASASMAFALPVSSLMLVSVCQAPWGLLFCFFKYYHC